MSWGWGGALVGGLVLGVPGAIVGGLMSGDDDDKPKGRPSADSWGHNPTNFDQSKAPDSPGANWTPTASGLGSSYGKNTANHPNRQVGGSGSW